MKNKLTHKPIVIHDEAFVTKDEHDQIISIAKEIIATYKKIEDLVSKYRDIIGYEVNDIGLEAQLKDFHNGEFCNPQDWVKHAQITRLEWLLKKIE